MDSRDLRGLDSRSDYQVCDLGMITSSYGACVSFPVVEEDESEVADWQPLGPIWPVNACWLASPVFCLFAQFESLVCFGSAVHHSPYYPP